MRYAWVGLAVGFVIFAWIGIASPIPVGVNTQEVRDGIESAQAANPDLSLDAAAALVTTHLAMAQRRRIKYLFLAYTAIWAGLLGYMISVARRTTHLRAEIERLKERAGLG